ncbi:MAG: tetratricopeptide repeat protein [Bradymonadales bacterium]|nr:tetratricopeptide repeat protein [Bradymonadales bacterium]
MSSIDTFKEQVRGAFSSLELSGEAIAALGDALGSSTPISSVEELVQLAFGSNKEIILLHAVMQQRPDQSNLAGLLDTWEKDANLQDLWSEKATARDLQAVKAYYTLVERALPEGTDAARRETVVRLLRKISRVLVDHPDNANGEYEVYGTVRACEFIGTGAIATNYRGVHLQTGNTVTVQVLKREAAGSQALVEFLTSAAVKLQAIRHPQIVRVLEVPSPDARPRLRPFFVLDWSGQGTLEDLIPSAEFSLVQRQQAAVKLCQGLAYAHSKGLVHGNLKPSNVLIDPGVQVRLSDFLAAQEGLKEAIWSEVIKQVGTPYYSAPEVASGQLPSPCSDIFSLGRLLFRLFTRKEENLYEVMVPQLFKQELEKQLGQYPDLVSVLDRCTALSPADRPQGVSEVTAVLHRFGGLLGVDDDPTIASLRAEGRWEELIEAQERWLADQPAEIQAATLEDMANVQEVVLDDRLGALATRAKALRVDPERLAEKMETHLDRLAADLDTPEAARIVAEGIAAVLEGGVIPPGEESLRLHLKAAELLHQVVGDQGSATRLYHGVLQIEPSNAVAYQALDRIYTQGEHWSALVAVLQSRLGILATDEERVALLFRIARIHEECLADLVGASETYSQIRQIDGRNPEAFSHLDRLFRQLERWEELAALLGEEIAHCESPAEAVEQMYSLATVLESRLERPADAVELYRKILESSPDHPETLVALESLMTIDVEALAAASILEPRYREQESWSKLATALEVLLTGMQPEEDGWVSTLEEIARIREEKEQDPLAAFHAWAQLHRGRPTLVRLWDELERLAGCCDPPQWGQVVRLYATTVEDSKELEGQDQEMIIALLLRIGRLQSDKLGDVPAAIQSYREVVGTAGRHMEALTQLVRLYGEQENWQEQALVLDLQRQNLLEAGEDEQARQLQHRIAILWEEQLESPEKAIEAWAVALADHGEDETAIAKLERFSSQPDHVATVTAILEPYYERRGDHDKLRGLWKQRLELDETLTAAQKAEISLQMARLAEEQQQRPEEAFEYYLQAVQHDSGREAIQAELERVTEAIGEWPRLVDFYDGLLAAGAIGERDRRQAMLFKLAEWYRDRLGDLSQAEVRFQQVLKIAPDHPEALDALDRLYTQQEQYPQLFEVLERRTALATEAEAKKRLLFRMAAIADQQLGDQKRAINAYSQVIGLDPKDRAALEGLASVYERQGNHSALLDTLKKRAAAEADPTVRVGLLTRIGDLARVELNEPATALSAYEEALSLKPAKPREIIFALAQLYLDGGDLVSWFALLPRYLDHTASQQEWVQLHLQAADLAVRPNAPASADRTVHYEAVLRAAPYHPDVLLSLEQAYTQQERWRDLLDIYRRQFIRIHLKAADLAIEPLEDDELAIDHLQKARQLDPDRIEILDRLRAVQERRGEWSQVVELMNHKLELLGEDPQAQRNLLFDLAGALEKQGEMAAAVDCLTKLVNLYPQDTRSLVQLVRLGILRERYSEIIRPILQRLQESEEAAEAMPLIKALTHLEKVVVGLAGKKPDEASQALERMLQVEGLDADLALALAVPAFEHHEASGELIRILQTHLKATDRPEQWRRALYRSCGRLVEKGGDLERAFLLYSQMFGEYPWDVEGLEQMLRLGHRLGRLAEATGAIENLLSQGISDTGLAVDLSLAVASVFDGGEPEQADPERAIAHYRRVLELQPGHLGALCALDRLYRQLERWSDLKGVLVDRIAHAPGPIERAELQVQLAALQLSRFGETHQAVELLVEVLGSALRREEKVRLDALSLLEKVAEEAIRKDPVLFLKIAAVLRVEYSRAKDKARLLSLLERRLGLLSGEEHKKQRFDLLVEMSRLARQYDDNAAAFRYTMAALREDARQAGLFATLEELARQLSRWQQLVAFQNSCLDRPDLPSESFRLELALKNAEWLYEHLNRKEDALASYKFALTLDETNTTALDGLEKVYEELGQREPLYHLLNKRADLASDPARRREYLERAARLAHHQLGQRDRAIYCYNTILTEFGPQQQLLTDLENLYQAAGLHQDLIRVMTLKLEGLRQSDPDAVGALLLRIGELAWKELNDPERAISSYTEALGHAEVRVAALGALVEIHEQREQWRKLVDLIRAQIGQVADQPLGLSLALKGARLSEEKLEDLDLAIALYQAVRQLDPGNEEGFTSLCRLLRQSGRWRHLLGLLRGEMERRPQDRDFQVSAALEIAEIAVDPEKVGNIQMAHQYLDYVLQIDPENTRASRLMVRLHIAQSRWTEAVDLLCAMLEKVTDPQDSIELILQRGDVYLEHLNQPERAAEDYRAAFQLDQGRSDTVLRLLKLLEQQGDWETLISVLDAHAAAIPDLSQKVAVALKTAKLIREKRLPSEKLFEVLENALALSPPYPANVEVVLQLVNAHYALKNLEEVARYTDMGLEFVQDGKDKKMEATFWYYKGLAATGQQQVAEALAAHHNCQRLDSNHVQNLIALGQLLSATREWDQAVKTLQLVLLKQSELDNRQRIDVYYMLGVAFANLADKQRAEDMFKRVLLLDKTHAPTLRALEALKES